MKKQITTISALLLAAALLTGCGNYLDSESETISDSGDSTSSESDESESSSDSESDSETNDESESEPDSEPEPKEIFVYGETEIPDIVPERDTETDDGKANHKYFEILGTLDSMVFETHTFGDYTIRLVGDEVRTDKENFPGVIYAMNLRVEVEKSGEDAYEFGVEGMDHIGYYYMYPISDVVCEEIIFEDQIGNYLDIYDMKYPVIAMRYFNYTNIDEPFRKIVQFSWIEDDAVVGRILGRFAENTGVSTVDEPIQFSTSGTYAIFSADEFTVESENTLVDKEAGIRYIFDFDKTDSIGYYYSTERIE